MRQRKITGNLRTGNTTIVDPPIRNQSINDVASVDNVKAPLLIHSVTSFPALDRQSVFAHFFVQPRFKSIQDFLAGANNGFAQISMSQLIRVHP